MELKNKVAIVTGSSKGLGYIITKQLLEEGATVIGWSRSETKIAHPQFESQSVNIGNEEQVIEAFNTAIGKYNQVDIIINNAGFGDYNAIENTDSDLFRAMFETNVFGIFYLTKCAVPKMKEAKRGHIINVCSIAGIIGTEKLSAYNGTKFAVKGMSESLFKELRPFGIKVTCVMPGSIQTEFFDNLGGLAPANAMDAADVADSILYCLKSPKSFHPVNLEVRPFVTNVN
jgi:short-subunit dehydrogenase